MPRYRSQLDQFLNVFHTGQTATPRLGRMLPNFESEVREV